MGECLLGKHEDLSFVMVMQVRNPRASGRDRQREAGPGDLMYLESMTTVGQGMSDRHPDWSLNHQCAIRDDRRLCAFLCVHDMHACGCECTRI